MYVYIPSPPRSLPSLFQLAAEKTITKINYDDMVKTFQINTLGHLLAFKHFVPLLPPKHAKLEYDGDSDPAMGLVKTNLSILASMTARVGGRRRMDGRTTG